MEDINEELIKYLNSDKKHKMNTQKIIPSIIASSQKELENRFKKVSSLSDTFHLDIMDGKFVENKSLNFSFKIPKNSFLTSIFTHKKFEAHLMVKNPEKWINNNAKKVDTIIFHAEPLKEKQIKELIKELKEKKKKVGIALNPETQIKKVEPFLHTIDKILILSVHPGKYGAKFLPKTLDKIRKLRKIKPNLNVEIDGGIDDKTINSAKKAGANLFVVGSDLQESENPKKTMKELKNAMENRN